MKPTALPKEISVEEVTYTKDDNRINVQHCDGVYSISTTNWEFKSFDEFIALFDCFKHKVEQPKFEEKIVGPTAEDIAARTAKKVEKKVRKDQFKTKWTDEQKQRIAKRYQNGEGPTSIAQDYGVTPNTIQQICLRMGVKRGKTTKKAEKPAVKAPVEEKTDQERKQTLKEYREKNPKPWYLQTDKR